MVQRPKLFGMIGVSYLRDRTFYVKRSMHMQNYPGVWSLPSIQFDPARIDPHDVEAAQAQLERMSEERLGGARLRVSELLTFGDSDFNPIEKHVYLYLYKFEFVTPPRLNPVYYTEMSWMTAAEYEEAARGQPCGFCIRLWSDYAWLHGITDRPFVPHRPEDEEKYAGDIVC